MGVLVELGHSGKSIVGIKPPSFDGSQPCYGLTTDTFFAEPENEQRMKMVLGPICNTCGFNIPCLQWALDNNERGIWAGTTEQDRRKIKRKR